MSADGIPSEWYFITPPQSVSWSKESVVSEINTYGTNNPYLNYGTTKLRKLTLGDAMIEGFSDGKQVEDNVVQLEAAMRMVIEEGSGYASPFCWKVFAGDKSYGTFIITGVNVTESMRDLSGKATRATVDVSLQEVAPYQVSSGTDITSTAAVGGVDPQFQQDVSARATENAKQDAKVAGSKGKNATANGTGTGAGSSSTAAGQTNGSGGATPETTPPPAGVRADQEVQLQF